MLPKKLFKRSPRPTRSRQKFKTKKFSFKLLFIPAAIFAILFFCVIIIRGIGLISFAGNKTLYNPLVKTQSIDDLREKLVQNGIVMESLQYSTQSAIITGTIKDGPQVLFSDELDMESQASSLHLIITRLTIEKKQPVLIDLRFDKPIVKF